VKIDVEGIEIKVLGGLEQTIARGKPNIFRRSRQRQSWVLSLWQPRELHARGEAECHGTV